MDSNTFPIVASPLPLTMELGIISPIAIITIKIIMIGKRSLMPRQIYLFPSFLLDGIPIVVNIIKKSPIPMITEKGMTSEPMGIGPPDPGKLI